MDLQLHGRTALVTGASMGIGRAIARLLAAEGVKTAIVARRGALLEKLAEEIVKAQGPRPAVVVADLMAEGAPARIREAAIKALGKVEILVNNAGIAGATATTWDTDVEEWHKVMRVNLDGPFICSRAVVPRMIAQNYGRIVNIASIAGKEGNPNAAHYSASKAGVIALTKSLGKELAGYNIAVNAVTPAAAKTAIFEQITQAHIDYMLSKIPRNRFVTVEEVAALVAWLVSEENSFTTGAVFDISGGRATY